MLTPSALKHIVPHFALILPVLCYFVLLWPHFITSPAVVTGAFALLFGTWQATVLTYAWSASSQYKNALFPVTKRGSWKNAATLVIIVYVFSHVAIILMGAPLSTDVIETASLSVLTSCLVSTPAISLLSSSSLHVYLEVLLCGRFARDDTRSRFVYMQMIGVIVGTWMSVFAIPLDWDRPWQKWPIPLVIGAISGYCVMLLFDIFIRVQKYRSKFQ